MSHTTVFITATDTGAGKTTITVALLSALRSAGYNAAGFKPVASGCVSNPHGWQNEDALALRAAAPTPLLYKFSNPYAFSPAIAPHLAAEQEGVAIKPELLMRAHAELASEHSPVLVEGAGGWLAPLSSELLMGDWVGQTGWPVLLVVGLKLGALNHALLSVEAIRKRSPLLGWVANVGDEPMQELEGNIKTLTRRLGPPLWRHETGGSVPPEALRELFPGYV